MNYNRLKNFLVIVTLLSCSYQGHAQVTFRKIIGGSENDIGYAVLQKADGGYAIAGGTYMAGSNDFYLIQTDKYGDTLLLKRYGGSGSDIAYDIIDVAGSTDYLILGTTSSFGSGGGDAYIVKIDSLGDTLWTKTYGGISNEFVWDINKTFDGGYTFTGQTASYGAGLDDIYVVKIDAGGDTLWTRTFGDSGGNASRFIYPITSGGYLVMGGGVHRIDENGQIIWLKGLYGGGVQFVVPAGEGYYLSGGGGPLINGYYSGSVILFQMDTTINVQWAKSYNIQDCNLEITAMDTVKDNGYIIAGEICATSILGAAFLIRIDSVGSVLWANIYKEWEQIIPGEITKTAFYDVKSTSDGGFIAVGEASNFFTRDVYMVKTDANGSTGCNNDSAFSPSVNPISITVVDSSTQVGFGGILSNTSTMVSGTFSTDNTLCFDTITGIDTRSGRQEIYSLQIFPNPTEGMLYFDKLPDDEHVTLIIRNILGQLIYQTELAEPELNIFFLPSGLYLLNLQTDKMSYNAKLVKE